MEMFTRGNLKTIRSLVKEFILGLMVRSIKDKFLMARDTEKESPSRKTRAHTKGNILQTIERGKEQ